MTACLPIGCDELIVSRFTARQGSSMLRDAILRAKGYVIPEPVEAPKVIKAAPRFRKRKVKRGALKGRPRGTHKIRRDDPKIAQIQTVVAIHFGLTLDELLRPGKPFRLSHPRQIAMYLSRRRTKVSYPDIARQFGGRHHTTVLHAFRQIEKRIAKGHQETLSALHAVHQVIGA